MKRHSFFLILSLVALANALPVGAQKDVLNAKMVGIGAVNALDTYLSPEHYRGTELRFVDHTVRRKVTGDGSTDLSPWSTVLIHQAQLALSRPRSKDSREIGGLYTFSYGRRYRLPFSDERLSVDVGAQAEGGLGFLYNTDNGNNPAQARVYLNIAPCAAAAYRFSLFNRPCIASYEVSAPLLGLLFSPNYGQSYYEIFSKGNYDHNLVPTTPVSAPSLRQMLTLDMTFGGTTLRLGYLGDIEQAKVNNLKYHTYSHILVIGFVRHFQISRLVP